MLLQGRGGYYFEISKRHLFVVIVANYDHSLINEILHFKIPMGLPSIMWRNTSVKSSFTFRSSLGYLLYQVIVVTLRNTLIFIV